MVALAACASGAPVDSVHSLMEPATVALPVPFVNNPIARKSGLVGAMQLVAAPRRAVVLIPAAVGAMALTCPDLLARLLVQLICFVGSLFEPFDTVLPQTGLMRACVTSVQNAKKAYNVKHGLVQIDDQQFFDDEDEEALAAEDEDADAEEQEETDDADTGDGDGENEEAKPEGSEAAADE